MNNKKMLDVAAHFKTVLPADDFVLTGSFALNLIGFSINFKDLDIILVNPKESTIDVLKDLQSKNPPKNLIDYPGREVYRFVYDGVDIDVFITKQTINTSLFTESNIKLYTVGNIVLEKLKLSRPKDYIQLKRLADQMMSQEKFDNYINSFPL